MATNDVDVCFSNITSGICASICTEVMQCWYESGNRCLVGSEVAILVYAVLNSFIGIGNSFTCLQVLEKSRMSAAYFLDVIDHKDEMTEAESPVTPQSVMEKSVSKTLISSTLQEIFRCCKDSI